MTTRSVTHATFTLRRTYPVPARRVFAAFADPKRKAAWFNGPEEWGPDEHSFDFRVGGRETSRGGPPGGVVHTFNAIYHDIVENERIIYSYDMHLDDTRISVSVATLELRPKDGGTELVLTEQGAFLDGFDDAGGREQGTRDLLDTLGDFLAREAADA
ncbi:activator of HSP90 ATPase [Youhaiella tibetensis]|uniref:Polyketide cyclase n=1 Tax=Paradevosia tibetensis TaxID=1447062 RepID=A0A5B9DU65_9HYPH|nr:SRPBCC family protein [Youhaiella tibetensis]QEE22612.1 polyketide cyclase [Youhaiella tibetensis]GGF40530.1 activator of HSP90 ATPase [Youhaiella tibetensis]